MGIIILIIVVGFVLAMTWMDNNKKKDKPYKCPVCDGRGNVPFNFYNDKNMSVYSLNEKCRTCEGDTIIWESEYE